MTGLKKSVYANQSTLSKSEINKTLKNGFFSPCNPAMRNSKYKANHALFIAPENC